MPTIYQTYLNPDDERNALPPEDRYRIRYTVETHPDGFAKGDANGGGLTNAIVVASILETADGGTSTMWFSRDGKTGTPLTPLALYKAWVTLAAQLEAESELGDPWRAIARRALDTTRILIMGGCS